MQLHITIKELVPILVAVMIRGHKWHGCIVSVYCDNEAGVTILNSRYCKEPHLMHMLHILFFAEACYQFRWLAQHLLGTCNTLADHLSRNQLNEFCKKIPLSQFTSITCTSFSFTVATGPTVELDIRMLDPAPWHCCEWGIAPNTNKTYKSAVRKFACFFALHITY